MCVILFFLLLNQNLNEFIHVSSKKPDFPFYYYYYDYYYFPKQHTSGLLIEIRTFIIFFLYYSDKIDSI